MKRNLCTIVALSALMLNANMAQAENVLTSLNKYFIENDIKPSVSAEVAFYDKYIWRGFRLDGDNVIQPAVTLGLGPLEGGFWGSWDMQNDDSLNSDELDGWIGLNFDLGALNENLAIVGVSVGHTWYDFSDVGLYSKEFYLTVSLDTLLSPSVSWYHDYEDEAQGGGDGDYFAFAVSHSFNLNEERGLTFDVGQEFGLNNEAYIIGNGGYSTTSIGLTVPLSDHFSMAPIVAFTAPWGDLSNGHDGNQDNEFWGGIKFSFSS